jgi:hypothetical protein
MGDGMLRDILEIERQIEAELAQERQKAETWLVEQKAEVDRQAQAALQEVEKKACQTGQDRCQGARQRGAQRLRAMRRKVRQLKALPDASLRQTLQNIIDQLTGRSLE